MICPKCHSSTVVKNGNIHNGKPKFSCKNCGRQLVEKPENTISQDKKDLIDKLLLERIPSQVLHESLGFQSVGYQVTSIEIPRSPTAHRCKKNRKENGQSNVTKWGLLLRIKSKNNGFG
jgi:transposase-like protein